jgi:hypothetical protein
VRHVPALRVGDDEQPGGLCRLDGLRERGPPGSAEALEARELRLDRDAVLAGLGDQAPAALGNGRGCTRIRVQPEADLATPLRDGSGEPIRESVPQVSCP